MSAPLAALVLVVAPLVAQSPPIVDGTVARPSAFLEMFVAGVVPTHDGHMLVLVNPDEELLLPVNVAFPEAVRIHGRLAQLRGERPATHELVEQVVAQLGGEVVRVQIDDVTDGTFAGSIVLHSGARDVTLQARPGDAVSLALASRVPIWVARSVVGRAALTRADLEARAAREQQDDDGKPDAERRPLVGPGVLSL